MAGRRIALVCAHFAAGSGYQEGALARAFSELGLDVRVVTSTRTSRNVQTLGRASDASDEGYEVVRRAPRLSLGSNVIGRRLRAQIAEFAPDVVVLVGPAKLFGVSLFVPRRARWKRLAILQDNSEATPPDAGARRVARSIVDRLVKRPAYRLVVANADRVVLNVPETRSILESSLRARSRRALALKAMELRLGFEPHQFHYDEPAGHAWRAAHGIADGDVLLVTVTRATAKKRLEDILDLVARLREEGVPVKYVLGGVGEDAYGRRLRDVAAANPDAFILLPVLGHDEMRAVFSAADIGFWPQAAISIQQAMGTGLPVVLKQKPTVSHLLEPGVTGWYADPSELAAAIRAAVLDTSGLSAHERAERRRLIEALNRRRLAYDVVAAEMISGL